MSYIQPDMAGPQLMSAPPPAYTASAYPTASYTPVMGSGATVIDVGPVASSTYLEATGSSSFVPAPGQPGPQSAYVAPATYAPTMYVSESVGSYALPGGSAGAQMSFSPQPTSYGAVASYQPPPNYQGSASYAPAVVEGPLSYSPVSYSSQQIVSQQVVRPQGQLTQSGSYVSADPCLPTVPMQCSAPRPQGQLTQSGSYVSAPGAPPPKLTEGMPDPMSVESQKQAHSKSIEAQLRQETGALAQRNQAQKQSLAQMVQQQKAQYNLQMDQYLQQQAMAVDQQANAEMMMLQEAAMAQKMALEQQAAGLTLEYQQRKAQEEMMAREYQIQKQYYDAEQKLSAQYQKHGVDGRLSQQEVSIGHQAINRMAASQPPMTYNGPPMGSMPMVAPMSASKIQQQPMLGSPQAQWQFQPPPTMMSGGPMI